MVTVNNPLIIVALDEQERVTFNFYPMPGWAAKRTPEYFGMLICSILRHAANFLRVSEDEIWKYVDRERAAPPPFLQEITPPSTKLQ